MADTESSQESDGGGVFDLFADIEFTPTAQPPCSDEFWNKLRTVAVGPNNLGNIVLLGEFSADQQLRDPGQNHGGLRYACARKFGTGDGYSITGTVEPQEGAVPVYWIPWKSGVTVYAERAWFENSICEYMITSQLSGCRFVVTERHVLHVASNAYGAQDFGPGSRARDFAEHRVTNRDPSRRLSISGRSSHLPGYKTYALAFGIKFSDSWQYKALSNKVKGGGDATWVSLMG